MPFLSIATNQEVSAEMEALLLREGSKAVAAGTGKPEQYVMVKVRGAEPMSFAGSTRPAAFLEVKSIGFPDQGVKELTKSLCALMTRELGLPGDRVYVVFEDVKAGMWGNDGVTFG